MEQLVAADWPVAHVMASTAPHASRILWQRQDPAEAVNKDNFDRRLSKFLEVQWSDNKLNNKFREVGVLCVVLMVLALQTLHALNLVTEIAVCAEAGQVVVGWHDQRFK